MQQENTAMVEGKLESGAASFDEIFFHGKFRAYQQSILDEISSHLDDKKIHIVAAPGSGKTILGLELIRRLAEPALILSPSVTIRQQWGQRFLEHFSDGGGDQDEGRYLSYHLEEPALMTSVTYQAVHAAWKGLDLVEENLDGEEELICYDGFPLVDRLKAAGVRTLCLDEAHHLQNEWNAALMYLLKELGEDITVVSLTATPPYDSSIAAWNRYIDLCGEIDAEISVPDLVAAGTLCPHQDYIYFNYPSHEEEEVFLEYRSRAIGCLVDILGGPVFRGLLDVLGFLTGEVRERDSLMFCQDQVKAILSLAKSQGYKIPKKVIKLFVGGGELPKPDLDLTELAFQFVLDFPTLVTEQLSNGLRRQLLQSKLLNRSQVTLRTSSQVERTLTASRGKLDSIADIVQMECGSLAESLRMVVLTDYIRKDLLSQIGTDENIDYMGAVPIFEVIRRAAPEYARIALLSGSLVICPAELAEYLAEEAGKRKVSFSAVPLFDTPYVEVKFGGSNKHKVEILTKVFQEGKLHILVGTKALLGEGWDSPCINSLVLASFVGSFVLSNQMRGRAIRTDQSNPGKTSNIWHLVTVEPKIRFGESALDQLNAVMCYDRDVLRSDDYETMQRRFACFMGPCYEETAIENGIERIGVIRPPYDAEGISRINDQMLMRAADRSGMAEAWEKAFADVHHREILDIDRIPDRVRPVGFLYTNLLFITLLSAGLFGIYSLAFHILINRVFHFGAFGVGMLVTCLFTVAALQLLYQCYRSVLEFLSPKKKVLLFAEAVYRTLRELELVKSAGSEVVVRTSKYGESMYCALSGGTRREKHIFSEAMQEMLSPMNNPRYIIMRHYRILFWKFDSAVQSYACPAVFGNTKKNATLFCNKMSKIAAPFSLAYTKTVEGGDLLQKCKRFSYIHQNNLYIDIKRRFGR